MKRGYIKFYRKSKDSMVFAHEDLWKLWCLCLMKANHEGAEVMIQGLLKPVKLEPGQFITGRNSLWEDYHQLHLKKRKPRRKPLPSPYTLTRWLLTLQEMQMLCIKSFNKYSMVTILNWELYQQNEHQVSIKRASSEHKQELNKELKEESATIYEFYISEINPSQKTRSRAIKNIKRWLKKHPYEDLKQAILNYKTHSNGRDRKYRKDPANFFGVNEVFHIDYLPENFIQEENKCKTPVWM